VIFCSFGGEDNTLVDGFIISALQRLLGKSILTGETEPVSKFAVHKIFSTAPIDISIWWIFIIAPMTLSAIDEFRKWLARRRLQWLAV
jgi:hypothetical protein